MGLFKSLKARIFKSIIMWSTFGKQTAQAKEVYCLTRRKQNFEGGANNMQLDEEDT